MYTLQLLLVAKVFSDIQRTDDGFKAEFSITNKGRLYNTLIYHQNLDFGECLIECIRFLNCVTFNYHSDSKTCELTDEDFDWYEADFDAPGWYNHGTQPQGNDIEIVDGGLTEWRSNGPCSATCGYEGKQMQIRECTIPKPKFGGADCVGEKTRYGPCKDVKPCLMVACEVFQLKLSCPDGTKIKILRASYGRSDSTTCPHSAMSNTNCHAAQSKSVMEQACNGENYCSIDVNSSKFGGDPCGCTFRYISVRHKCEKKVKRG